MTSPLDTLLDVLRCPGCRGRQWTTAVDHRTVTCARCGRGHRFAHGVLTIDGLDEHPEVAQERASVPATETTPALGGWREVFTDATSASSSLAKAYLSLPYGNSSEHFQEPGYFRNVQRFAAEFDFILRYLPRDGMLLDVGADGTWSTARLATRGLTCIALDITDHLSLSRLFQTQCPPYACVNVDMHTAVFADCSFEAITSFNALHHSKRLFALATNLARMLKPGGVLGIVEPYVQNAAQQAAFGASQSAAGINENVHTLDTWDQAFVQAGLSLEAYTLSDAFNAVYRKRTPDVTRRPIRSDHYQAAISIAPHLSAVPVGSTQRFAVTVSSVGRAGWSNRGTEPVGLSYHLSRDDGGTSTMVRYENERAWLTEFVSPGHPQRLHLDVAFPEAGTYDVTFELVHETHQWFGTPATARVTVS